MRDPVQLVLKVLVLALVVQAKHGETSSGGDDDKSSTSSTPPSTTSSSSSVTTSTSTSTSSSTTTPMIASSTTPPTSSAATTSSSAAPSSTAIPPNALQFPPPGNVTTCTPATFTWEFNSTASVPVAISITNEREVQFADASGGQMPLVERTLSSAVDARTCFVTWSQVDVPSGAYSLIATDTNHTGLISVMSPSFFVTEGNDTSCVNTTSSAPDTSIPQTSSGPKSLSTGALVGIIVGILAGVVILLVVFSLPRLRRRFVRSDPPPRPGAPYHLF